MFQCHMRHTAHNYKPIKTSAKCHGQKIFQQTTGQLNQLTLQCGSFYCFEFDLVALPILNYMRASSVVSNY